MWPNLTKESTLKPNEISVPKFDKNGNNKSDFYFAGTLPKQSFARNYAGYPRSDVAMIEEQADLSVAKSMLQRLTDYSSASNPTHGMSDQEIMMLHRSKYFQTPSETIRYVESQLKLRDERITAIKEQRLAAEKAKADFAAKKASSDVAEIIDKV